MEKSRFNAVCFSLIVFFASAIAISDGPFIVVHKKVTLACQELGTERVTVSIDVYNKGYATAYDVSLNDDSWSHDRFDVISGSNSKTCESGATVSHSFVLETHVKGPFQGSPAVIKYRVPTTAVLQAYSTPIQPLDILADMPPEKKFEWAKRLLAKYGSLVSVLILIGLFLYVVASPSKFSAKGSKRKR